MKKTKILSIFVLSFVLIELLGVFLLFKSHGSKELVKNNINFSEVENNNNFALMLEQNDGTFKESNDSDWPSDEYKFSNKLSECVNENGSLINTGLSYKNGVVKLQTTTNTYCYLYFYQSKSLHEVCSSYDSITECNKKEDFDRVKDVWNSNLDGDGYRYVGTNPDNYICFGTSSKDKCLSDTDKYMYRIIGIFNDESGNQHLKVIKKEALNSLYEWHNSQTVDISWDQSSLYNGLHGTYFMNNNSYPYMQDKTWLDKIENWKYIAVNTLTNLNGISYRDSESKTVYLHEMKKNIVGTCYNDYKDTIADCKVGTWKTVNSKIGLMYASDYLLANGDTTINLINGKNASLFKSSWININNNDTGVDGRKDEWLLPQQGVSNNYYGAYLILEGGYFIRNTLSGSYLIRPVFYLTSNSTISSGKGSLIDPFVIKDKEAPINNSVLINNNSKYTISRNVTLSLSSLGATEMCISNTSSCSSWETYNKSKTYTLSTGDGNKTVYVFYKDDVGNITSSVSDSIILDTTPPTAPTNMSYVFGDWSPYTDGAWTNKSVYAASSQSSYGPSGSTDANGIAKYQISVDNKNWLDYNYNYQDGVYQMASNASHNRYFRAVDNAGNAGPSIKRTANIDKSVPKISAVNTVNGATYNGSATTQTVYTDLTFSDTGGSGIKANSLRWKEGTGAWNSTTNTSTTSYRGSWSGERNTTGYYQICDNANNCSEVSFKIWIDKTKPTITASILNNASSNIRFSVLSNEAGTYCINKNATETNMSNCVFSGSISANSTVTTGKPTSGGNYYVHVKDAAGNIKVSGALNVLWCNIGTKFGACLKSNPPAGFNATTAYNGLYRFIGDAGEVNNYVKLIGGGKESGFRVIGVRSKAYDAMGYDNESVKLIKTDTMVNYQWHTNSLSDVEWDNAYLNTYFLNNIVINNTDYIPSGWSSQIDNVKWFAGVVADSYVRYIDDIVTREKSKTSASAKVGLINLSDAFYSSANGGFICVDTYNFSNGAGDNFNYDCETWMTDPYNYYWTINRKGYNANDTRYVAWLWGNHGRAYGGSSFVGEYGIRAVIYLLNTVTYQSGFGTESDPFILGY